MPRFLKMHPKRAVLLNGRSRPLGSHSVGHCTFLSFWVLDPQVPRSNIQREATGGHDQEFSMDQLKVRLLSHSLYAYHQKNVRIKTGNNTF